MALLLWSAWALWIRRIWRVSVDETECESEKKEGHERNTFKNKAFVLHDVCLRITLAV